MKNILVTGAAGFVGSNLCRELVSHGYNVVALCRKNGKSLPAAESAQLRIVMGDISDKSSLIEAMQGIDTVYHIAAVFREAKFPDSYYFEVNTRGTQNVIEAAKECGVGRLIHCSTTGVHGHIKNPPGDETTPFAPRDVYQVSKCKAEELINDEIRRGSLACTIIRPAMIWGPGDRRILKLFRGIARGWLPIIGSGRTWCHWILIDDLVRAFRLAGEKEEAIGQTFIIAGDRPIRMIDVYKEISKFFNKKLSRLHVPVFPLWLVGAIAEILYLPLGKEPPIYRRRVDFYTKNRSFNTSKAKRLLGFEPSNSFEEELKIVGSWYLKNQWI